MAWEPTAVPRELHGQPVHITLEGVPTQRLPNGKIPSESRLLVLARHRAQLDVRQDGPPAAPSLLHPSRPLSPCLELSGLWHVTCHPLLSMASPPSTAMLAYPQKTKVKGDYKTVSLPQQLPLRLFDFAELLPKTGFRDSVLPSRQPSSDEGSILLKTIGCGVSRRVYETSDASHLRPNGGNGTTRRLWPSSWLWRRQRRSCHKGVKLLFQPTATRPSSLAHSPGWSPIWWPSSLSGSSLGPANVK